MPAVDLINIRQPADVFANQLDPVGIPKHALASIQNEN